MPTATRCQPVDVANLYITCIWATLGLAFTMVFALGFGLDVGQTFSQTG